MRAPVEQPREAERPVYLPCLSFTMHQILQHFQCSIVKSNGRLIGAGDVHNTKCNATPLYNIHLGCSLLMFISIMDSEVRGRSINTTCLMFTPRSPALPGLEI